LTDNYIRVKSNNQHVERSVTNETLEDNMTIMA